MDRPGRKFEDEPTDECRDGPGEKNADLVPVRAKVSGEAVQGGRSWRRPNACSKKVQPEDRPEVERLMNKVRTALTDRQWDQLTNASNELADTLFYLEDLYVLSCLSGRGRARAAMPPLPG